MIEIVEEQQLIVTEYEDEETGDVWTNTYIENAVGKCECGKLVELANLTNTCECGAEYNMFGQELGPREFWGEETGEHWSECI